MSNFKTVPNQKVVKVKKEICNKQNLYAAINLDAMEAAALDLEAGAFKLWVYFAKNQNDFNFALSSKEVENNFGIKIKQYTNAIKALQEKGYLVAETGGNTYTFHEKPVVTKGNNVEEESCYVVTKGNNDVVTKGNNALLQKVTRNITNNTNINNTAEVFEEKKKKAEFRF